MYLYLVRHGDAVSESENAKRPLSDAGVREIRRVAQFLKNANARIDVFYHSGKLRARQTAEIIQKTVNPKAPLEERSHLSPMDSVDAVANDVVSFNRDTMIVGHMPFMASLVARLVLGDSHKSVMAFPTGCVAVLKKDSGKGWTLAEIVNPEFL